MTNAAVEVEFIEWNDEAFPGLMPTVEDGDAEDVGQWLANIGSGAATGATTGAVAGPWGALIGGLVGGGLGAVQTAMAQNQHPAPAPGRSPVAPPPPGASPSSGSSPRPTGPQRTPTASATPPPTRTPVPTATSAPTATAAAAHVVVPPTRTDRDGDAVGQLVPVLATLATQLAALLSAGGVSASVPSTSEGRRGNSESAEDADEARWPEETAAGRGGPWLSAEDRGNFDDLEHAS